MWRWKARRAGRGNRGDTGFSPGSSASVYVVAFDSPSLLVRLKSGLKGVSKGSSLCDHLTAGLWSEPRRLGGKAAGTQPISPATWTPPVTSYLFVP